MESRNYNERKYSFTFPLKQFCSLLVSKLQVHWGGKKISYRSTLHWFNRFLKSILDKTRGQLQTNLLLHINPCLFASSLLILPMIIHCLPGCKVLPAIQCEWSPNGMQRADIRYIRNKYVVQLTLYIITWRRYMQKLNIRKKVLGDCLLNKKFTDLFHCFNIIYLVSTHLWINL